MHPAGTLSCQGARLVLPPLLHRAMRWWHFGGTDGRHAQGIFMILLALLGSNEAGAGEGRNSLDIWEAWLKGNWWPLLVELKRYLNLWSLLHLRHMSWLRENLQVHLSCNTILISGLGMSGNGSQRWPLIYQKDLMFSMAIFSVVLHKYALGLQIIFPSM